MSLAVICPPNHGAWIGDRFWFLGSTGWDRVGADEVMREAAGDPRPLLLHVRVTAPRDGRARSPGRRR